MSPRALFRPRAGERRMLPERGVVGAMSGVVAVTMLLMVLAAAAGLTLHDAAARLGDSLAGRVTVQVVDADRETRDAGARAAEAALAEAPGVRAVHRVDEAEMARLLEPWLGRGGLGRDLPLPAMIDAELAPDADRVALREAVRRAAPSASLDEHGAALAPLAGLIGALQWLAAGIVLLVAAATGFVVVLAARSALHAHRETIEVMHLMGATDRQIARLFQRRLARDVLLGGLAGFALAAGLLLAIGAQVARLGSELVGSARLDLRDWLVLAALPLLGMLLATATTRWTALAALGRQP